MLLTEFDHFCQYYHFCQKSITAWKQKDAVETEAKCARCVIVDDKGANNVEFQCVTCSRRKHISAFNPVTIRAWQDGKRGVEAQWVCFDCLHPTCGMCHTVPVYSIVHNSRVKKDELLKHAANDEQRSRIQEKLKPSTLESFRRNEAVWFCMACKYPSCDTKDYKATRDEKMSWRFLPWLCAECEDKKQGNDLHPKVRKQLLNLETVVLRLDRLPNQRV